MVNMKIAEDVAVETNNPPSMHEAIPGNETLEHLPLDVCLELEVIASSQSFGSSRGNNDSMEVPIDVPNVDEDSRTTAAVTAFETNIDNGASEPGGNLLVENEQSTNIEAMDASNEEKSTEPQVIEAPAPEASMDVVPADDVPSVNPELLEVKVPEPGLKKRSIDEELEAALIRIPSEDPSPSADFIRIYKDEFKIGRKPDNDEVILSVLISRNHCILKKDVNNGGWFLTNLSSTDTLLNDEHIERNQSVQIRGGDILQLSLADTFKYEFTFVQKNHGRAKHPRLELNNEGMDSVLDRQKSFVQFQENERKDLEKLLNMKQQEQEELRNELEKLLQDQKVTKTCNEELNNQIAELQKKIELGNSTEVELTGKYRDLLNKLEEERFKFEEKLAEEKQRYQEALRETKQEKERLEMTMVEQMEEWRVKVERKQQEEWQKKIDGLLCEEKIVQTKLQSEKQLLEQKLKEMAEILKQREEQAKEQEKARQQQAALAAAQMMDQKCVVVLQPLNNSQALPGKKLQVQPVKNPQHYSIVDTIDLTDENGSASTSSKDGQRNAVIEKVNSIMDEQMACSICSELFIQPMLLSCSHTYCKHCIQEWIKRSRDCPNCRRPVVSMSFSLALNNFIEKMVESLTPEQMAKRRSLIEERNGKIPKLKTVHVIKKVVRRR